MHDDPTMLFLQQVQKDIGSLNHFQFEQKMKGIILSLLEPPIRVLRDHEDLMKNVKEATRSN